MNDVCMSTLSELKHKLTSELYGEMDEMTISDIDTVINAIHHLAECERNCYEACYYKSVTEAMKKRTYHNNSVDDSEDEYVYGRAYNDYRQSMKHYTETHSEYDKEEMDEHAIEHVGDTILTLRDVWNHASVENKQKIKADLTSLLGEMKV